MAEHARTLSAVFPIILREVGGRTEILLHRRQNTGFMDGLWDISASGHVDEGETATQTVVRECMEEIGITVRAEDVKFAHLSHRFSPDRVYYDIYFAVQEYSGTPRIMEPDKCSELAWFDIENLPADIIALRKTDIQNYKNAIPYSEKLEGLHHEHQHLQPQL